MSEENVEIVRRAYEAGNRGDLEAAFADYDPEIEAIDDPRVPGAKTLRGVDEIRRFFESMARYWESVRTDPERLVDLGDDVYGIVYTLEEGLIRRGKLYPSPEDALKAAWLRE